MLYLVRIYSKYTQDFWDHKAHCHDTVTLGMWPALLKILSIYMEIPHNFNIFGLKLHQVSTNAFRTFLSIAITSTNFYETLQEPQF